MTNSQPGLSKQKHSILCFAWFPQHVGQRAQEQTRMPFKAVQSYAHDQAIKVQTGRLIDCIMMPISHGLQFSHWFIFPFTLPVHHVLLLSLIAKRGICFQILIPHTKGGWIISFFSHPIWIDPLQQIHNIQERAITNNGFPIIFCCIFQMYARKWYFFIIIFR